VKGRVLVVEDDKDIAFGIRTVLSRAGFDVAGAPDGKQGLRAFHDVRPDLVILDIGLQELDGWAVLERIRDLSDVPVLVLTAHGQETEKVRGLTAGADDYLTKPFGNQELAARVATLLRRQRLTDPPADVYDDGSVQVKFGSHEVSVNGVPVVLTPTEFRLLTAFVRHAGQTLTPEQLLDLAWNDPWGVGPERVKFSVMRLRRKLGQAPGPASGPGSGSGLASGSGPGSGSAIEAVRGFGYRYQPPRT
jgi:DNA-binding response OmpR family regulator